MLRYIGEVNNIQGCPTAYNFKFVTKTSVTQVSHLSCIVFQDTVCTRHDVAVERFVDINAILSLSYFKFSLFSRTVSVSS